jgi:hypothetical protein
LPRAHTAALHLRVVQPVLDAFQAVFGVFIAFNVKLRVRVLVDTSVAAVPEMGEHYLLIRPMAFSHDAFNACATLIRGGLVRFRCIFAFCGPWLALGC